MKRVIAISAAMAAAVAMTFALAGIAFADAGPHGGYGPGAVTGGGWSNTDKCAGCHRAHTGQNTYLMTEATEDDLCKSCHQAGAGAGTDVWAGLYTASSNPLSLQMSGSDNSVVGNGLNAGGFDYAFLYSGTTNTPTGSAVAVTSKHDVGQTGTAWGGGVASGAGNVGPGYVGTLECSSCHNPHGDNNYRMLNGAPAGHGSTAPAGTWVTSSPYMMDGIVGSPEIASAATKNYTLGLNTAYDRGISDFCAGCHTNYLITRSWGKGGSFAASTATNAAKGGGGQAYDWDNDGIAQITWRHAVGSKYVYAWSGSAWVTAPGHDRTNSTLNTAYSFHLRGAASDAAVAAGTAGVGLMPSTTNAGNQGRITCLTCHNAHGTAATSTGYAANAGVNAGSSAILFLDGRGMCQNCHNQKN